MSKDNILWNFVKTHLDTNGNDKIMFLKLVCASVICSIGYINNNLMVILAAMLFSPIGNVIMEIPKNIFLTRKIHKMDSMSWMIGKLVLVVVVVLLVAMLVEIISNKDKPLDSESEPESQTLLEKTTNSSLYYAIPISICVGIIFGLTQVSGVVGIGIAIACLPPIIACGIYLGKIARYNIWKSQYDTFDSSIVPDNTDGVKTNSDKYQELLNTWHKPLALFGVNISGILTSLLVVSYILSKHIRESELTENDGQLGESDYYLKSNKQTEPIFTETEETVYGETEEKVGEVVTKALNELEMVDGDGDGETEDSFINREDFSSNYSETDDVYKIEEVSDATTETE